MGNEKMQRGSSKVPSGVHVQGCEQSSPISQPKSLALPLAHSRGVLLLHPRINSVIIYLAPAQGFLTCAWSISVSRRYTMGHPDSDSLALTLHLPVKSLVPLSQVSGKNPTPPSHQPLLAECSVEIPSPAALLTRHPLSTEFFLVAVPFHHCPVCSRLIPHRRVLTGAPRSLCTELTYTGGVMNGRGSSHHRTLFKTVAGTLGVPPRGLAQRRLANVSGMDE